MQSSQDNQLVTFAEQDPEQSVTFSELGETMNVDMYRDIEWQAATAEPRENLLRDSELNYAHKLEELVRDDMLFIGALDTTELERDEHAVANSDQDIANKLQASILNQKREIQLLEQSASQRISGDFYRKRKALDAEEKNARQANKYKTKTIEKVFQTTRNNLKHRISEDKKSTRDKFGKLRESRDRSLGTASKKSRFLNIYLEQCRAVKNKLPCAYYVILVTLWDRPAGARIENTKLRRVTTAKRHGGRYFHNAIRFEECLELLVPSAIDVKPTMVITFEMFILKNRSFPYDREVAFGIFPLCNSDFQVAEGKFKVPMIRGALDPKIAKFSEIEDKYRANLDEWVCNLYFQTSFDPFYEVEPLKFPEQFEEFSYSVTTPDGLKNRRATYRKFKYMFSELFADFGFKLHHVKYAHMWLMILVLLFALWIGRFTHYFGQWALFKMLDIEVTKFKPEWVTFSLYFATDLQFESIIGHLFFGSAVSLALFMLLCLVIIIVRATGGEFTTPGYRVISCYGLAIILDPIVTIIEHSIRRPIEDDFIGDPFLLSNYFDSFNESDALGPIVTVLVYVVLMLVSMLIFYAYLLYLHMEGRMLDNYTRLTAPEFHFYIPYDNEVSLQYLKSAISRAHSYKSTDGRRRVVAVGEYQDSHTGKPLTHIAIINQKGDNKTIYRHFIRLPTGSICELSTLRLGDYEDLSPTNKKYKN